MACLGGGLFHAHLIEQENNHPDYGANSDDEKNRNVQNLHLPKAVHPRIVRKQQLRQQIHFARQSVWPAPSDGRHVGRHFAVCRSSG